MEEKALLDDVALSIPGEYGHPIPRELMLRELGFNGPFSRHSVGKAIVSATLKTKAVHTMCTKNILKKKNFKLPPGARTTFHMAFSPDGRKVASCHGDHNVYVSDIATLNVLRTLSGHPRTPWCVVFHPTQNDVLASGCLAGHVRVWDLDGGSELLVCDSGTVIASLSFHPTVRLLAIATFNEIIFWDWAVGPYPLARCSTGNTKEKVRLVRFDRLGHCLVTGITNFPNPPGSNIGEAETSRSSRSEPRSAFFRPNILSRTPQPTSAQPTAARRTYFRDRDGFVVRPDGLIDDSDSRPGFELSMSGVSPAAAIGATVAQALTVRQERFQESYRQLVNHYEGLVQHYQQFIRTRLVPDTEAPPIMEFIPISESDDTSPETSNDSPPIDIVVSENPSLQVDVDPNMELGVVGSIVMVDEIPGPSTRLLPNPDATIEPEPSTSSTSSGQNSGQQRNTHLRSIQALEQNIVEMQNLCSQARRDSSNFPIENVHIQELRTIRRHLEALQDQTRRLQTSIRQTLSSLARGTGNFETLRGRLTSIIPGEAERSRSGTGMLPTNRMTIDSAVREPFSVPMPNVSISSTSDTGSSMPIQTTENSAVPPPSLTNVSVSTEDLAPVTNATEETTSQPVHSNYAQEVFQRFCDRSSISNPYSSTSQRVPPVVPMQYEFDSSLETMNRRAAPISAASTSTASTSGSTVPPSSVQGQPEGHRMGQALPRHPATLGRLPREFITEAVHEHSRFCPYGEGNGSRPPSRMRCITDMGGTPLLNVWPTMETGHDRAIRNFRLSCEDLRPRTPTTSSTQSPSSQGQSAMERNNNNNHDGDVTANFPSFGNWMGQGPAWINNDLGVRVYLIVRQFNNLRNARDQLLAAREHMLNRHERVTNALARIERMRAADSEEMWQRHFNSGLAFVPSNVREGSREYRRVTRPRSTATLNSTSSQTIGEAATTTTPLVTGSDPPGSLDEVRSTLNHDQQLESGQGERTRGRPMTIAPRRDPPSSLTGNFARATIMRVGDDFIPVYSHLRDRDIPQQNIFVFPIGLFLEGDGWMSTSIAIYWPPVNREEEESMTEFRRTENLIPIITEEAESLMDARSTRYRIEYDSTRLTIHVAEGHSLTFIQPGLTLLDVITTMAHFQRPRENAGTVYVAHLSPFLDAIERIFGYRRRRELPQGSFSHGPGHLSASGTLRLSTVLQPGPYSFNRAVQYSIRARRMGEIPSAGGTRVRIVPGRNTEEFFHEALGLNRHELEASRLTVPSYPVNVRLRRELLRDWDRATPLFRTGMTPHREQPTPTEREAGRGDLYDGRGSPPLSLGLVEPAMSPHWVMGSLHMEEIRRQQTESFRRQQSNDWRIVGGHRRGMRGDAYGGPVDIYNMGGLTPPPPPTEGESSDSASLASTRRVIRLAVATAASSVLRRSQDRPFSNYTPNLISDFRTYETTPSRAIESRIERVLNERGNRGGGGEAPPPPPPSSASSNSNGIRNGTTNLNPSASTQTMLYSVWGQQTPMTSDGGNNETVHSEPIRGAESMSGSSTISAESTEQGSNVTLSTDESDIRRYRRDRLPVVSGCELDDGAAARVRGRQTQPSLISEGRGIVTSARPLRRPYLRISSTRRGGGSQESDEDSDEDEDDEPLRRVPRLVSPSGQRRGVEAEVESSETSFRRRAVSPDYRLPQQIENPENLSSYSRRRRFVNRFYTPEPSEVGTEGGRGRGEMEPVYREHARIPSTSTTRRVGLANSRIFRRLTDRTTVAAADGAGISGNPRDPRNPPPASGGLTSHNTLPPHQPSAPSLVSHFFRRVQYPTQEFGGASVIGSSGHPMDDHPVGARFYPGYIPEIVITPRARPPNYYTLDASTTAFLSSRIQKWDFSSFLIPNIQSREESVVVKECSLHSDACLDLSNDGDFMAVCIPSDSGSYSAVGIYSIRDESLGDIIHMYHFDQNTVSVSISPSCDYIVVGYAGRGGPLYRFVQSRTIGQVVLHFRKIGKILSLTRDGEGGAKLVSVKELFADNQSTLMSINCMHWVPVSGYGIIYGTNTGDLVLLS